MPIQKRVLNNPAARLARGPENEGMSGQGVGSDGSMVNR